MLSGLDAELGPASGECPMAKRQTKLKRQGNVQLPGGRTLSIIRSNFSVPEAELCPASLCASGRHLSTVSCMSSRLEAELSHVSGLCPVACRLSFVQRQWYVQFPGGRTLTCVKDANAVASFKLREKSIPVKHQLCNISGDHMITKTIATSEQVIKEEWIDRNSRTYKNSDNC
ncbi:hypothetical protein TNCV_3540831 [Trichonephila clavipes]|nr:hypothetical protein TNCV_3540831 [Trichonephila clavipes]